MLGDGLSDKERQKIDKLFSKTYWKWASDWVRDSKKFHGPFLSEDQWWECHNAGIQAARNDVARRCGFRLDYVAWFNKYLPACNARFGTNVQPKPHRRYPDTR